MRAANLVFIFAFTLVFNAKAEELRYRFAEGETLRYRVTQAATLTGEAGPAGSFESTTTLVAELAWAIQSVDDQGIATIEQTVPKLKFKNSSPVGEVGFDSESDEPAMGVAAMLTPAARALQESKVTLRVSPTGEVTEIRAEEELVGSLERVPGASEVIEGEPVLRSLAEAVLPLLPAEDESAKRSRNCFAPSLGERKLATEFQRGATQEAGVAQIASRVLLDGNTQGITIKKSEGIHLIDEQTGRLIESAVELTLDLSIDEATSTVEQQVQVEAIESVNKPE